MLLQSNSRRPGTYLLLFAALAAPCAASAVQSAALPQGTFKAPHILLIVGDDVGHNDVGWSDKRTLTPTLDAMVRSGVELEDFYSFKYCAPTRGALMTSRYPYHFGFYQNQDANRYGVPTNFSMLPEMLKRLGRYQTSMIGKWVSVDEHTCFIDCP